MINTTTPRPLFIPLRAVYYDAFANGTKTYELRKYGPRWNEKVCTPGRAVVLSRGYGKEHRLAGTITEFFKEYGVWLQGENEAAILSIYGTLNIDIAVISIRVIHDRT